MKRLMMAAALAAAVGLSPAARADGVRVEVRRGTTTKTVYDNPKLLDALARAWDDHRSTIDREIEKELGKLNPKLPRKVNFARQHSELAKAKITTAVNRRNPLNPTLDVEFEVKGNLLTTRFTTPTVFGSYADPEFKVTYDIRAVVKIPVPERARMLKASEATFEVQNVHIEPENETAKLVDFATDVYHLLGGKDYKATAEKLLSQKFDLKDRVNGALKPVNKELEKVTNANTTVTVAAKNGVLLHITSVPPSRAKMKVSK